VQTRRAVEWVALVKQLADKIDKVILLRQGYGATG
jgi:hypothetical protein